jgi:hypothetical protein
MPVTTLMMINLEGALDIVLPLQMEAVQLSMDNNTMVLISLLFNLTLFYLYAMVASNNWRVLST